MTSSTRRLVIIGLLTAVSIVLTRFASIMIGNMIRLSFGEVPIILSGLLLGPAAGGLTGAAADLVGFFLNPHGAAFPHPGFTLTAALTGILPVTILRFIRRDSNFSFLQLAVAIGLTDLLTSIVLNTLWLTQILGRGFFVLLPMRAVARVILFPMHVILVNRLYAILRHRV